MDDLTLIDLVDHLKSWLALEQPVLAEAAMQRMDHFKISHSLDYYRECFLAALCGANPGNATHRRELARAIEDCQRQPDRFAQEIVAEEPPRFYARIPSRKRQFLVRWIKAFDIFENGDALHARLREAMRLEQALAFLRETFRGLAPLDHYRILKAWHYPVLMPSMRKQWLLFRLGLLESRSQTAAGLRATAELGERMARTCGEDVRIVDVLLGALCGDEPALAGHALCGGAPQCGRCCIRQWCAFFRYRKDDETPRSTIKDLAVAQRPRERLMRDGAASMTDADLLAILLRTGSSRLTAVELALNLLKKFHGLAGLNDAALAEFKGEKGMGEVKAVTLKAALELGRRLTRDGADPGQRIACAEDVYCRYQPKMSTMRAEQFHMACMDMKHRVMHECMISQGSLSASVVHPREAFAQAIRHNAAAVIFFHNHPSGDPTPSRQDEEVTQRLQEAARVLGIPMLDHVILGNGRYYSFTAAQLVDVAGRQ